ncbi:alpha/beta hydrolase fold domain-containing protein [Fervidobacterium sp.]
MSYLAKLIYYSLRIFRFSYIIESKMLNNGFDKSPTQPGRKIYSKAEVLIERILERCIWEVKLKNTKSDVVILFLHGGAYISNITKMHWNLVEKLIDKTNAVIVVPDYPLASQSTWKDTYNFMDELYSHLIEKYKGKKLVFIGDSAGGGLALGFAQKLRDEGKLLPEHIFLFSPWLDLSMEAPELENHEKRDAILTIRGLKYAAKIYAGNNNLKYPYLSPIYGNLSQLCPITIFTGTNDLLHSDSHKLREILLNRNLPFNYFEYPNMFHDWVIFTFLPESLDVLNKVHDILKR